MSDLVFHSPAVFVRDMAACKDFYAAVLGQPVVFDLGDYVAFQGFSLWQEDLAGKMIHGEGTANAPMRAGGGLELYFESGDLDGVWTELEAAGVPVLHAIVEQSWGQRCFRILDPDGRIVEVAETMGRTVRRLLDAGEGLEAVAERTMMPLELARRLAEGEEVY